MMKVRPLPGASVAGILLLFAAISLGSNANAQRVSVQDMQAQIDALTFPYDEPAAQVRSALDILPAFQEAVVRHYRETGEAAIHRQAAGLTAVPADTQTSFISAVSIINGSIIFYFGNSADASIAGTTLTFTPYETYDMTVVWRCANMPVPAGNVWLLGTRFGGNTANYQASTVPLFLQPSPCILKTYPGSSDDVIRTQVLEPFKVVQNFQAAVEAAGVALGSPTAPQPPIDRTEAGLTAQETDTQGRYFESIDIVNGTITVRYGNDAHPAIVNETISWTPYESADGTIVWRCGYAFAPPGISLMGVSNAGGAIAAYIAPTANLDPRYFPYECRP